MNCLNAILEEFPDDSFLRFDGFDEAVIGVCMSHWHGEDGVLVYAFDAMIELLVSRDGMTHEEASEFIHFNTIGAYVGTSTPIVIYKPRTEEP